MTRDEKYILIVNKLREITFLIYELQKEKYKQLEGN